MLDQLIETFAVSCLRLEPERREHWIDDVLRHLDLPLAPPQIDLFTAPPEPSAS
jgi:hypothetical protein